MIVRRGPAVVLSLGLSAAAFAMAPTAIADDGGPAKDAPVSERIPIGRDISAKVPAGYTFDGDAESEACGQGSRVKVKVDTADDGHLVAAGIVFSDDGHLWSWKFKHNDDVSADGEVRADDDQNKSFKIVRTMVNFVGPDSVMFRAEDEASGEVCKVDIYY
jgi:hypothetical protein